jgi:hypothetical protein
MIEQFRQRMTTMLMPSEGYYFVDSMPLEICKTARAKRSRVCQDVDEATPQLRLLCSAQRVIKSMRFATPQGVVKTFDISTTATYDIHFLNDLKTQLHHCVLVGDKGLSRQHQQDLFETAAIRLRTTMRRNRIDFTPFSPVLRKARKHI